MKTQENLILDEFNDACSDCRHIAKEGYLVYMHTFERDFRRKKSNFMGFDIDARSVKKYEGIILSEKSPWH